MAEFHFLRPYWLLSLLLVAALGWRVWRQMPVMQAWKTVCDSHLLPHLLQVNGRSRRSLSLLNLLLSLLFIIISLAGPTWSRLPVPTYQKIQPRVLLLDMSSAMQINDLTPDRLSRAKFKLHDLLLHTDKGQFGLIAYTGEPFIVSPLTEDGQTIDELLSSLTPDIMPLEGNRLDLALKEGEKLIKQSGLPNGQILVFTANKPTQAAIDTARQLAKNHITVSVMPVFADQSIDTLFKPLAKAGLGQVIPLTHNSNDLEAWLNKTTSQGHYEANGQNDIPVWRDQGRWFLIPAMLLFLPIFRRGWLQRIYT